VTTDSVVIVGAGQAGFQAAVSLRDAGFEGRVVLIGDEPALPYQRPPLSKAFLAGKATAEDLNFRPGSFYERNGIELISGQKVLAVDRSKNTVQLRSGSPIAYGHLILATGARPRRFDVPGARHDGVMSRSAEGASGWSSQQSRTPSASKSQSWRRCRV
jgi:3-phenylpropionate/trans-cinnamate dioxygenase ferredoxin reductase component